MLYQSYNITLSSDNGKSGVDIYKCSVIERESRKIFQQWTGNATTRRANKWIRKNFALNIALSDRYSNLFPAGDPISDVLSYE